MSFSHPSLTDEIKRSFLKSRIRDPQIKVEIHTIKNIDEDSVDFTLHGILLDDDYSYDSQSDVRRMYNMRIKLHDIYQSVIAEDPAFFFTHSIKLSFKIGDVYINIGTFLANTFDYSYSPSTGELSLSCEDKMCTLNGERGGIMPGNGTVIPASEAEYLVDASDNIVAVKYSDKGKLIDVVKETLRDSGIKDENMHLTDPDDASLCTLIEEKCICWGVTNLERNAIFYTGIPVCKDHEHALEIYDSSGTRCTFQSFDIDENFPHQKIIVVPQNYTFVNKEIYTIKYYAKTLERYIPYDLEFNANASRYELLSQLRDLNTGWEIYFEGEDFYFKPIDAYQNNPDIVLTNDEIKELVISESNGNSLSQVHNVTEVWGTLTDVPVIADGVLFASNDTQGYVVGTYILDHPIIGVQYTNHNNTPIGTKIAFTACETNADCLFTDISFKDASGFSTNMHLYHSSGLPVSAGEIEAGETYTVSFQYVYAKTAGAASFSKNWILEGKYEVGCITKLYSSQQHADEDKANSYIEYSNLNALVTENRTNNTYRAFVPEGTEKGTTQDYNAFNGEDGDELRTFGTETSLYKILYFDNSVDKISFTKPSDKTGCIIALGSSTIEENGKTIRKHLMFVPAKGCAAYATEEVKESGMCNGFNTRTDITSNSAIYEAQDITAEKLNKCVKITVGSSVYYVHTGEYDIEQPTLGIIATSNMTDIIATNFKAYHYNESTRNIRYDIDPDSPFTVDKIGEYRQVLSDGDYANITTSKGCEDRSKLENWKSSTLKNTINLEIMDVPWLDINDVIEYAPVSTNGGITGNTTMMLANVLPEKYVVLSKSGSYKKGTATLSLIKHQSMYDWQTE